MKVVEKITLILYSNIILIISIIACLLIFGWLDIDIIGNLVKTLIVSETSSKIILGISIVFILLSIRCIFFDPASKQEIKDKHITVNSIKAVKILNFFIILLLLIFISEVDFRLKITYNKEAYMSTIGAKNGK